MTTLRVEIPEEKDLPLLQKVLKDLGLNFTVEESDPESFPGSVLAGINSGLKDLEDGKVFTHEEARSRIEKKIAQLHLNNAS